MKNARTYLVTAAVIALLGLVAGFVSERTVIAGAMQTLLTSDVDNPARHPFQVQCLVQYASLGCSTTVPKGKRLVIETLTASLFLPQGQRPLNTFINLWAGGVNVNHALITTFIGPSNANPPLEIYTSSQNVRLYADPGTSVLLEGITTTPPAVEDDTLTMSGYYVDLD